MSISVESASLPDLSLKKMPVIQSSALYSIKYSFSLTKAVTFYLRPYDWQSHNSISVEKMRAVQFLSCDETTVVP